MKRSLVLVATLSVASLVACGGGGEPGKPDTIVPDYGQTDHDQDATGDANPEDRPETSQPDNADTDCPPAMNYVEPMDDEANGFHVLLGFNTARDLKVKVTTCGTPSQDQGVTFTLVKDDKGICYLDSASASTGEDGIAYVNISSPQDKQVGQCQVEACLESDPDQCLVFNINVSIKDPIPLVVGFEDYVGEYPQLSMGKVLVFRNDSPGKPDCAALSTALIQDKMPTASKSVGPISILTTAQFKTLPGLAEGQETSQVYTVLCLGTEQGSTTTLAYGCVDDVPVELHNYQYVECPLNDIPPRIVGTYNITSYFDLVSGLPPNVATVVDYIIDFFASPTATVMKLLCDPKIWTSGSGLQDLCDSIFVDPSDPKIDHLTAIGDIARTIIDTLLVGLLVSNCPYEDDPELCETIYFSAKDIGGMLQQFILKSQMICTKEPDANGLIPLGGCREKWNTVVLHWTLGKGCDLQDEECGKMEFNLSSVTGTDVITADIEAQLVEKNKKLAIAPHPVNIRYGALLDFALEQILLPQVFGNGEDGLPRVDTFEEMIGSLLAGRECLDPMNTPCCEAFAQNLSGQTGGTLGTSLIEGACDALVTTGSEYIRNFLVGLDADTGNFTIGTPADQPCAIYDTDSNMKFDALGKKSPETARCVWDTTMTLGGWAYKPQSTFWGVR